MLLNCEGQVLFENSLRHTHDCHVKVPIRISFNQRTNLECRFKVNRHWNWNWYLMKQLY